MRCASCASVAADGARFCDQCGAAFPARRAAPASPQAPVADLIPGATTAAPDGDRRIVTALFADLVDYVRMLAEHDPEEVRTRVTAALAAMAEAIAAYEGTREKFIGDAVFAVFGWPRSHDDDAVRAGLAALAIRAGLLEIGDGSEPMEVRIGIATGEVVASAGAPNGDGDLGLTGKAITTAARIQSLARPGEIMLDGATLRAARGRLATDAHGSVVLRGQSTPVELFTLRGEAGLGAWAPHRAPAPGPIIGRAAEIGRLRALFDAAHATGRGGVAVVTGDAGVGKSRLLAAMEPEARERGLAWTWTENVSYARGEPYRFARLFAQTVADERHVDSGSLTRELVFTEDLPVEALRRYGGAIAAIARDASFSGWEDEASDMPADPAEVAAALLEVAARYVDRLMTTGGPRVVVIDDLHWLDPSSIGMVDLLADATAHHPLVLLVGSRPGHLPGWAARPGVVRIDLRGLRAPETATLATHVARAALDADGARRIHERTGGNPLFIGETVRSYLEDGTLEWRDGRVALIESGAPRVPVTLRAVLGARIDALDRPARDVLGIASVIGIRFDVDTVGRLRDGDPPGPAVLDRLASAALIERAGPAGWRFAHPLIHDVAYAGLLASRRRVLHARMADLLEVVPDVAPVGEIASHRAAAGDVDRALPLLREAAAAALTVGAAAEAAAFWRQAADLVESLDPEAARRDRALADRALPPARGDGAAVQGPAAAGEPLSARPPTERF
jgi:adenylate cyclase